VAHALSTAWHDRGLRLRVTTASVAAVITLIGVMAAYQSPSPSYAGAFAAVGVAAVAIWMLSSAKTHVTLAILMVYLGCVDGVVKNMSGSSSATLGRDVLLYSIAIGILVRRSVRNERYTFPPLSGWILALVVVVAVQLFNPGDVSLKHSLASTRPHLEFVPLFFLGYSVLQTRRRIKGFLMLLLVITAVNGAVGLVQFGMSPQQLASWGPGYSQKVNGENGVSGRGFVDSTGQGHTRPFALGSDAGFGGGLGVIALPAAFALLSLAGNRRLKIATGVLTGGVVLAIVTSQSRTHVIGAVIAIIAFMLLATSSRRAFRLLAGVGIGAAIGLIAVSLLASNTSSHLFDRYSSITPGKAISTSYNYKSTTNTLVLPKYLVQYPLGAGIGKSGPAGNSFGGSGGYGIDAESEATYLVADIGIPGLIVLFGFQIRLALLSLRVRRLKDMELRLLLAALGAPFFVYLVSSWVGITTAAPPFGSYLWFIGGVLSYWLIDAQRKRRGAGHPA
jgi:hypothetical protein